MANHLSPEKKYNFSALHILKFVVAACVVIFHFGENAWPFNEPVVAAFFFQNFAFRVPFFFFFSGFILSIRYQNQLITFKQIIAYFWARLARIYPLYLLGILVMLVISFIGNDWPSRLSLVLNMLMLQSWVEGYETSINYVNWSISAEFFFYLSFPALFLLHSLWKDYALLVGLFLWLSFQLLLFVHYEYLQATLGEYHPLMHWATFQTGILVSLAFQNRSPSDKGAIIFFFLTALVLAMLILFQYFLLPPRFDFFGYYVPFYGLLISWLLLGRSRLAAMFSLAVFQWLGKLSYAFFILQVPVWLLLQKAFILSEILNPTMQFYLYFLFLLFISALVHRFVEEPLRFYLKSKVRVEKRRITA